MDWSSGVSRRDVLKASGAAMGAAGVLSGGASEAEADVGGAWGAIYVPSDAFNFYQVWADYDRGEVERDLGYAEELNLDTLRVPMSYEHWWEDPGAFESKLDHFLGAAGDHGLDVLPVLYESIGDDPMVMDDDSIGLDHGVLEGRDVEDSFAVHSPSRSQVIQKMGWNYMEDSPREFTAWFSGNYGTHENVAALEIMNEPRAGHEIRRHGFVRDMMAAAHEANPEAPLTMGSKQIENNYLWERETGIDLDLWQFHHNIPPVGRDDPNSMGNTLEHVRDYVERKAPGRDVWLTEWQRERQTVPPEEDFPDEYLELYRRNPDSGIDRMVPNYESLAETLRREVDEGDVIDGAAAWGLMLKPAYIREPRQKGRFNGLFCPDGSVYDLGDAKALAGEELGLEERHEMPEGMEHFLQRRYGGP